MKRSEIRQIIKEEVLKEIKILRPGSWRDGADPEVITLIDNYIKGGGIGDLELSLDYGNSRNYVNLKTLPNNFKVGGELYLNGTLLTHLPPNLKVGGDLHVENVPSFSHISPGLEVGGDMWLGPSPIRKLPPDLKVGGSILLMNANITTFPDTMQVGGEIYDEEDPDLLE